MLRFWQQPDGTYGTKSPTTKSEMDITPCYTRTETGDWHYTATNMDNLHWRPELPKEIQLHLFLLGEE